ncbi:MAG: hypothetical protein QM768_21735 [Agriterribacter sp.]
MRGALTLFHNIFTDTDTLPAPKQRKGRSADLIEKRNDLLIHRYVFYCALKPRLSYEFVIEKLAEETFLSPVTIPELIAENRGKIHALRQQEPTKSYFQKKYPHFVWEAKSLLIFN